LTKQVIAAAKDSGAIVVVPGNVYVFGTQPGPWSAKTPKTPVNQLGKIRADMEDAFRAANIPLILLRAGDFIDTQASGNWFDMILTKSLGRGRLTYPGLPNIQHNWAYLPDYARAVVDLCEANLGLRPNIELGFPGYNLTGQDLAQSLNKVTQREVVLKEMSWIPLRLAAPFWPLAKEILTMRYLWNHPHSLDTSDFTTALPEFQSTDISSALKKALA
jgi:nucleoside-diphosphate-sugar epimerase